VAYIAEGFALFVEVTAGSELFELARLLFSPQYVLLISRFPVPTKLGGMLLLMAAWIMLIFISVNKSCSCLYSSALKTKIKTRNEEKNRVELSQHLHQTFLFSHLFSGQAE
jgi:hypothetical protein